MEILCKYSTATSYNYRDTVSPKKAKLTTEPLTTVTTTTDTSIPLTGIKPKQRAGEVYMHAIIH